MVSAKSPPEIKKQKPGQKISREVIKRMSGLGLYDGCNIFFEGAVSRALDFCEQSKDFKTWLERIKIQ